MKIEPKYSPNDTVVVIHNNALTKGEIMRIHKTYDENELVEITYEVFIPGTGSTIEEFDECNVYENLEQMVKLHQEKL